MFGQEVLAGNLQFISLADLFQILSGNKNTGILQLSSPYIPHYGWIYFINGSPVNAVAGPLRGLDALYRLFGWIVGTFQFHERAVTMGRAIHNNSMHIVLDALRMIDDGLIQTVGASSNGRPDEGHQPGGLPIIKGPLVDYMHVIDEQKFENGESIVTEGNYGKWIWVVLHGMVEITQHTPWGPAKVARLGEGSFIGTFSAFQFKESTRTASVTAKGETYLGLLNTLQLSEEFACVSPDFRRILISLAGRMKKITTRVLDLAVANEIPETCFPQETGLQRDDLVETVFTIIDGEAHVVGETQRGPLKLVTLEQRDFFGHLPFMKTGHEPYFATVCTSKDLLTEKLDAHGLQKEYEHLSGTFRNLIENISTCVSVSTRLAWNLHQRNERADAPAIH